MDRWFRHLVPALFLRPWAVSGFTRFTKNMATWLCGTSAFKFCLWSCSWHMSRMKAIYCCMLGLQWPAARGPTWSTFCGCVSTAPGLSPGAFPGNSISRPSSSYLPTSLVNLLYVSADVAQLEVMTSDYYVGLYSVASKVTALLKQLLGAVIVVTVPRLACLYG